MSWPARMCCGGADPGLQLSRWRLVGVGSVLYHGPMSPGADVAHDGSIVALAATVPLAWRRRSLRRPPAAAVIAGAAAIVVNLLTRTGAPLCRPGSVFQGHGAWHVLTAIAIALWFAPPSGSGRVDASPHELSSRPQRPASPPVRSQP